MALPGSPGKGVKHGRTPAVEWIDVPDVPYAGSSKDLPKVRGLRWRPEVVAWWEQVRQMPHCVLWSPTDWIFGIETAFMKQDWWQEYSSGVVRSTKSTEIRRREDQMGTTVEARRKLRIRYVPAAVNATGAPGASGASAAEAAAPGDGATVTDLDSRRARLIG